MRRTKAALIYRRAKNLGAVQLLVGHIKLESGARHLGIEVEDARDFGAERGLKVCSRPRLCKNSRARYCRRRCSQFEQPALQQKNVMLRLRWPAPCPRCP